MSQEKKRRRFDSWWEIIPEIIFEVFPALFRGLLRLIRSILD